MTRLTNCILNKDPSCVPIWFMRQAGRYLPEFRKIRSKNKDFIKLCLNSNLSSEITLQPLKRFKLDAAIIFSDILMVPFGLGQEVNFVKEVGPVLSSFNLKKFTDNNKNTFTGKLNPIYEAIKKTKKKLSKEKSLISFIGAPWTIIVYMFELKKNKNHIDINKLKESEVEIKIVIDIISEYLCAHIHSQIKAGADVVQIFDSWAGLIPNEKLFDYCYKPNKKIVDFCKINKIPVICFPKGINQNYLEFANTVRPDCLSLDYEIDPMWARNNLSDYCLQGGLDPKILFKNENVMLREVDKYLQIFKGHPYIFNLGHGLLPETDPKVLQKIVERVNNFK
jgi:uroporphyrinogen decarboxylase